jgi:hypothetical protein
MVDSAVFPGASAAERRVCNVLHRLGSAGTRRIA